MIERLVVQNHAMQESFGSARISNNKLKIGPGITPLNAL